MGPAKNALPLIVECAGEPAGLAWGLVHDADSKTAHVYSMWISPDERGKGIAKALPDRIRFWAVSRKCDFIELSVTENNDAAINLYQAYGFVPSGQLGELREGSALKVQKMVKDLRNAA